MGSWKQNVKMKLKNDLYKEGVFAYDAGTL